MVEMFCGALRRISSATRAQAYQCVLKRETRILLSFHPALREEQGHVEEPLHRDTSHYTHRRENFIAINGQTDEDPNMSPENNKSFDVCVCVCECK